MFRLGKNVVKESKFRSDFYKIFEFCSIKVILDPIRVKFGHIENLKISRYRKVKKTKKKRKFFEEKIIKNEFLNTCLLYTSPSPRDS